MELRPIKTKQAYRAPVKEAEALWHAPEGSKEGDRLEVLTLEMIRRLSEGLGIPAEVLIRKYELKSAA